MIQEEPICWELRVNSVPYSVLGSQYRAGLELVLRKLLVEY